ncbi:uncharacterized protein KZ484_002555 [Pholidichthys leucotaenia]
MLSRGDSRFGRRELVAQQRTSPLWKVLKSFAFISKRETVTPTGPCLTIYRDAGCRSVEPGPVRTDPVASQGKHEPMRRLTCLPANLLSTRRKRGTSLSRSVGDWSSDHRGWWSLHSCQQ